MNAYTFVVTVENAVRGDTARMLDALSRTIRDTAQAQGFRIIPCGWSPDQDTIADALVDPSIDRPADYRWPTVQVVDLNPGFA